MNKLFTIMLAVAAAGGVMTLGGCSHTQVSAFEACLKTAAESTAAADVQAIVNCHGDKSCIVKAAENEAIAMGFVADECAANVAADGGSGAGGQ